MREGATGVKLKGIVHGTIRRFSCVYSPIKRSSQQATKHENDIRNYRDRILSLPVLNYKNSNFVLIVLFH